MEHITQPPKPQIGITTTVPVEALLAAGLQPVDLNNRFITNPAPHALITRAEELGMPRTLCAWIKGMYAWLLDHPEVRTVLAVTQGDCSNTHALAELLRVAGRRVINFEYPTSRDAAELAAQIQRLCLELGTGVDAAEEIRQSLTPLRADLAMLDELTWREGLVRGEENHLWLVSASDFDGDPDDFHTRLKRFLDEARGREPLPQGPRLGVLGVPPVFADLHQVVAEFGGAVVYNEVARQFSMPAPPRGFAGLTEQYLAFSYPYDIFARLEDIIRQAELRGLDGLIHYTQTFCHRQIQDIILRQRTKLPVLTLEGDAPGPLDGRTRLRVEAFLEMLD